MLRLRSAYYRWWYEISQGFTWSRRQYHEEPARRLPASLTSQQQLTIQRLQLTYNVKFENQVASCTALENYEYLDLFDQAQEKLNWQPTLNQEVVDVGSLNFYYAPSLHACFHPRTLSGIELEGYRVYTNLYNRFEYAQCYIRPYANTSYRVMDFCDYAGEVDGITCFYPFVIPGPLIAWRLPLKVFQPQRLFEQMSRCLKPNGFLLMMNHGEEEAQVALAFAQQCGLQLHGAPHSISPLFPRAENPFVSLWHKN
mgnify:CR=1 FL=1